MVGSRAATRQACARTSALAAQLGQSGFFVVSGGALGIDAAAHTGALQVGAPTFAVLGCGVDVVYPDRHQALFARVAQSGGLLSELPPGTPPHKGQFPVRNRLVAALAEVVLVVEARRHSGALITARRGRELGRLVCAVPGSSGTDGLIAAGAALPVTSADDVLDAAAGRIRPIAAPPDALLPLLTALQDGVDSPGALSRRLERSLSDVLALLFEAELTGWVRKLSGGRYEVSHAN